MRFLSPGLLAWYVMGLAVVPAFGETGKRGPTTRPSSLPTTNAVERVWMVSQIDGLVQMRSSPDADWRRAELGARLGTEAQVRIGLRSSISLGIGSNTTIILDRLGRHQLGKLLPIDRTRYEISDVGEEHQITLISRTTTLMIRGCTIQQIFGSQEAFEAFWNSSTTKPSSQPTSKPAEK